MNGACTVALGVCVLIITGCAATTYAERPGDDRVQSAFEQPFRDVSWMRETPPEILVRAAEAPYALAGGAECAAILEEIAALDQVLGPDVDLQDEAKDQTGTDARGLLSGAIRGVIGLPYRSIVRRLSGAERRERELREAILAGMARRAFLKGVARATACASPPPGHVGPPP